MEVNPSKQLHNEQPEDESDNSSMEDDEFTDGDLESDDEDVKEARRLAEEEKLLKLAKKEHKKIAEGGMRAELKSLQRRFDKNGNTYYIEQVDNVEKDKTNWWEKFALCLVHQMDRNNKMIVHTQLQVNSQHLKDVLKETIKSYPGCSFTTQTITIAMPGDCLYHYRREIREAIEKFEPGSEAAHHGELLNNFIAERFADAIKEGDNLKEQGFIDWEYIWTIFRPDTTTVFTRILSQPRAFVVKSYAKMYHPTIHLQLQVEYLDYDGEKFGKRTTNLQIPYFTGMRRISSLSAFPMEWHANTSNVSRALIKRGRKFEALFGQNLLHYHGIGIRETDEGKILRFSVDGRVMVDCKTYHRLNPNGSFTVQGVKEAEDAVDLEEDEDMEVMNPENMEAELVPTKIESFGPLSDHDALLATPRVRGFSFINKEWMDFFVDSLSPIEWNDSCFDRLVLAEAQKDTVRALVSTHSQQYGPGGFDDIVKGKGKGLVFVLHGSPGVGKTLTAECVAEYAHRPLYIVSSGELGIESGDLDEALTRILDMAATWRAVLLIDEADVFLEERSPHDLQRNALVSIFLRVLEYYEGIMFLTTNRVQSFDEAFKSRIHVPLRYDPLPQASRRMIWKNFLETIEGGADIDEAGYDQLSQGPLNGRQIKNAIRTARSLAQYKNQKLDLEQLLQVMHIQTEFELDLGKNTLGRL